MWPRSFCVPVTHDGMEGQRDQTQPVVKHVSELMWVVCQIRLEGKILSNVCLYLQCFMMDVEEYKRQASSPSLPQKE